MSQPVSLLAMVHFMATEMPYGNIIVFVFSAQHIIGIV